MRKKTILIINSDPFHNGPRMIKEIDALKNDFEIIAVGRTAPLNKSIKFVRIDLIYGFSRLMAKINSILFKKNYLTYLPFFQTGLRLLIGKYKPDIVINHNPIFFPAIFNIKKKFDFKVVYNAHEYHPMQFENQEWLRTAGKHHHDLYDRYLKKVDLMINVCDSIAEKCKIEYNKDSIVIPNAAPYNADIKPTNIDKDSVIKLVHHGASVKGRKIENMIDVVGGNPRFTLDLMLIPNDLTYYNFLKEIANKYNNIHFIQPVGYNEIVKTISAYDIGVYMLNPGSFNNKVALPNKLFEFIQARLAVIVSPNDEIAALVKKHDLGKVTIGFDKEDFEKVLEEIKVEEINLFKNNADKVAKELSAEIYNDLMLVEVQKLVVN